MDRHKEKPLKVRLGKDRERFEERAALERLSYYGLLQKLVRIGLDHLARNDGRK